MGGLIVRNGDAENPRIGIDWRAVAALVSVLVVIGSGFVFVVQERLVFAEHLKRGEVAMTEWQDHRRNYGALRHMTAEQERLFSKIEIHQRIMIRDLGVIKRKLGIDTGSDFGADVMPPGMDD